MDDANSVDSMLDFIVAQCGTPPPRYEDASCKKKGNGGGKQKCVCRTAIARPTEAKGYCRQAKPEAKQMCRAADKPDVPKKRPPSPWVADACKEKAVAVVEPKRREAETDSATDCPLPPPSPDRCLDRTCAYRRRRRRRHCEDDAAAAANGPTGRTVKCVTAAAAAADGCCCCYDGDDDCCCRYDVPPQPPPPSPSSACGVHWWYGDAFDWVCGKAWSVALAAAAFFAGMYANDYCQCVYDDDS